MRTQFGVMALGACLLAAPVMAMAGTWSATGPKGGTSDGNVTCAHQTGSLTCDRSAVYVSPKGVALDREADRVTADGVTRKTIVTTGEAGRSVTATRTREN